VASWQWHKHAYCLRAGVVLLNVPVTMDSYLGLIAQGNAIYQRVVA